MENNDIQILPFMLLFLPALFFFTLNISYVNYLSVYQGWNYITALSTSLMSLALFAISLLYLIGFHRRELSLITIVYTTIAYFQISYSTTMMNSYNLPFDQMYLLIILNIFMLIFGGITGFVLNPRKGKKRFGFL